MRVSNEWLIYLMKWYHLSAMITYVYLSESLTKEAVADSS